MITKVEGTQTQKRYEMYAKKHERISRRSHTKKTMEINGSKSRSRRQSGKVDEYQCVN